jgi:hypothetical protein
MTKVKETNQEVIEHLKNYIPSKSKNIFSWATDGCSYEQHIRFVEYRNNHWDEYYNDNITKYDNNHYDCFDQFILEYIKILESELQE